MKKILLSKRMLSAFIIATLTLTSLSAANWFVKANASGTGASWDDPCNISVITGTPAGIADGDVVYMAAGTYESSTSKSIVNYISIIGGYPASSSGTSLPARNLVADSTVFVPSTGGTARCLVLNATTAPGLNKIVLDGLHFRGFTMTTGNGGTAISITTAQSNIDFKNLSFKNNISLNANGGAIYMGVFAYNITISFDNCNFINNQANVAPTIANGYGGAVYFNNGTTAKTVNFTNCNFKYNKAYMRAAAVYYTQTSTLSFTDCMFDTNQLTNATDAASSGGGFYIAGGGSAGVTLNTTRCVFVNSNSTQYGSVIYFNTTPKNTLNMTDCSLIGNFASRTTSTRAAIDCGNFVTTLGGSITGSVLSNYNWSGGVKASNKADFMAGLALANYDNTFTFSNSILNGVYIGSSNALAAVTAPSIYTTTGYLADSTIVLALSGDLKITDKIVFNKTFVGAANIGSYIHTQIFDVKRNTGKAMTLNTTIPYGYKITVNGTDYSVPGLNVIQIAASGSDPVISFSAVAVTAANPAKESNLNFRIQNDNVIISGVHTGTKVGLFNAAGQILSNQVAKTDNMTLTNLHSGVYILTIGTERLKFVK